MSLALAFILGQATVCLIAELVRRESRSHPQEFSVTHYTERI